MSSKGLGLSKTFEPLLHVVVVCTKLVLPSFERITRFTINSSHLRPRLKY